MSRLLRYPLYLLAAGLFAFVPADAQRAMDATRLAPSYVGESGGESESVTREALVMGTRLAVQVAGPSAATTAETVLTAARNAEDLLSTWRTDTELAALNSAPVGTRHVLSPALLTVLEEVDGWVTATDRAFDPAIGALVRAWDIRGEGRTPGAAELAGARRASGWDRILLEAHHSSATRTVRGVTLDAGGFDKGLALREAVRQIRAAGAEGVLNFGGQVAVVGPTAVTVGIAHAARRDVAIAELSLRDGSVATTSLSERPGHVLDPRTGRPVEAWGSVTVVAEDAMVADLLSTALYVMGGEAALSWAQDTPYGVLVQTLTPSGDVTMTMNPAMETWMASGAIAEASSSDAMAEAPAAAQDTSDIERLKRQVEAITRELERLRLGDDVVVQADTGVLGFGPGASKVYQVERGVSIGGYGEILYRHVADELEDGTPSPATNVYDALRAIVYLGYKFNDRLLVNTEIEIEHANEAYLEFAYLDYRLSDVLGFRGGILLSPMGLVNELHEPPVFLGTTRPLVESAIIPTTWRENGLGIFGDVGPFSYRAYVLNGLEGANFSDAGLRGGRQKGSKALAEDLAGVLRVDYTGTLGLLVGGSVYYGGSGQGITTPGPNGEIVQANTLIWEGHASYQSRGLDLRALVAGASVDQAALLNDAGAGGVAESLGGWYAHAGYDVLRFTDSQHELFPYIRYESINTQKTAAPGTTVDPANERTAVLVGASWRPVPQVAVKADYQLHSNQADTGRNQFALVLSYLF